MVVGRSNWLGVARLMRTIAIGRAMNSSRRATTLSAGGATSIGAMLSNWWRVLCTVTNGRDVGPRCSKQPKVWQSDLSMAI